eukprot:1036869-Rhodomonas_salina.5
MQSSTSGGGATSENPLPWRYQVVAAPVKSKIRMREKVIEYAQRPVPEVSLRPVPLASTTVLLLLMFFMLLLMMMVVVIVMLRAIQPDLWLPLQMTDVASPRDSSFSCRGFGYPVRAASRSTHAENHRDHHTATDMVSPISRL